MTSEQQKELFEQLPLDFPYTEGQKYDVLIQAISNGIYSLKHDIRSIQFYKQIFKESDIPEKEKKISFLELVLLDLKEKRKNIK